MLLCSAVPWAQGGSTEGLEAAGSQGLLLIVVTAGLFLLYSLLSRLRTECNALCCPGLPPGSQWWHLGRISQQQPPGLGTKPRAQRRSAPSFTPSPPSTLQCCPRHPCASLHTESRWPPAGVWDPSDTRLLPHLPASLRQPGMRGRMWGSAGDTFSPVWGEHSTRLLIETPPLPGFPHWWGGDDVTPTARSTLSIGHMGRVLIISCCCAAALGLELRSSGGRGLGWPLCTHQGCVCLS